VTRRAALAAPLAVLSPHLDDAVLGCGRLLARHPGSVVITLFAGRPGHGSPLTGWDRDAGFREGDDVIGARRGEDAAALARLGARPVWLDFRDAQYGGSDGVESCADACLAALRELGVRTVLVPLGLFHSDHVRTREAGLAARARAGSAFAWYVYGDGLYRTLPGAEREALGSLCARGFAVEPVALTRAPLAVKREAVACYASQLGALSRCGWTCADGVLAKEATWRLR
jgi:LmbE family N-acetylglucosaminyl deacetylase